jgi:hypothetical protein
MAISSWSEPDDALGAGAGSAGARRVVGGRTLAFGGLGSTDGMLGATGTLSNAAGPDDCTGAGASTFMSDGGVTAWPRRWA